ncbi:MAG TPA: ABC transporter permease [Anaerolineales bacterium]|nr:ABC transporter permease [Anaerolineales bacterium]
MDKLWVVAFKDIRTRFTDRRLLMIMFAAPLAIATIIGLAFGGLGRSSSPISHIPVAVINEDQPVADGTAFGSILAGVLTTGQLPTGTNSSLSACPQNTNDPAQDSADMGLGELIAGTTFNESLAQSLVNGKKIDAPITSTGAPAYLETVGKAAVDKGLYSAVVIIPADFSRSLASLSDPRLAPASTSIAVYGNGGDSLSAVIVRSVVDSITAQLVSGNIAIGATLTELASQNPAVLSSLSGAKGQGVGKLFACAFVPGNGLVQLADLPVQAAPNSLAGILLVTFGSAQALFFALFTGINGVLSMYDERHNGTLGRILVSPTPRWVVLGGKLVGTFVTVLAQLIILMLAMTAVGSVLEGRLTFIWGNNVGMLFLVLMAVSLAVSGLGVFLAGLLKDMEQAATIRQVLTMALGVLGGTFGFQLPRSVAQFSLVYWGRDAFEVLSAGHGEIWLNLLVLFVEGAVLFGIGLFFFNRKFEV